VWVGAEADTEGRAAWRRSKQTAAGKRAKSNEDGRRCQTPAAISDALVSGVWVGAEADTEGRAAW
jgi:F0F1-type ATP synthase assembly protein I